MSIEEALIKAYISEMRYLDLMEKVGPDAKYAMGRVDAIKDMAHTFNVDLDAEEVSEAVEKAINSDEPFGA